MSNNFIKRSGKLSDNSDLKLSDTIKIKILASDSEFSILAKLNTFLNLGIIFQSTSSVCMSYYIDAKTRASPLNIHDNVPTARGQAFSTELGACGAKKRQSDSGGYPLTNRLKLTILQIEKVLTSNVWSASRF